MNLLTRQVYGNKSVVGFNTYIGGVSATISTAALLATKLGISVARIENFTIVGADIKCKITGGTYTLSLSYAPYMPTSWTYFKDTDNLVITDGSYITGYPNLHTYEVFGATYIAGSGYFGRACPLLKEAFFPNALNIPNTAFYESNCDIFYIPRATTLGSTVGDNQVFNGILFLDNVPKTIYCHPSLATNNGGAPDGDIAYAISIGATVRYVTNFTAPNPVTTLSAGTIYNTAVQLNFTAPTGSTNAIDYYEVYVNGVLKNKITSSGQHITGLSVSTSYNITLVAVDIFYNKSAVSNTVNVSTVSGAITDLTAGTIYNTAVQLNFTDSIYGVNNFKCYADGVLKNNITASGQYVTGLTPSTSYNITLIGNDPIHGDTVVSNSLSVTTDNETWDITTGLVSYYKLDETSGTVANDSFGSDNLTNTGVSINQRGKVGTAYKATAATQKLQTSSATGITGNFTLNMWVFVPSAQTVYATPFEVGNYGTNTGFGFLFSSNNTIAWRINQIYNNYNQSISYAVWNMITMVYNGTNVKFYVNGVLTSTVAHTANPNTTQLRTAFYRQDQGQQAICSDDEISIHNTALTQTEIDLLYNSGNGITL